MKRKQRLPGRVNKPVLHIPDQTPHFALPRPILLAVQTCFQHNTRCIQITLPFPISSNRYWRRGEYGNMHVSDEARDYKKAVGLMCQANGLLTPFTGDVEIITYVYRNHAGRDLNNCTKVLYDALQGYIFEDDNQIAYESHVRDYDIENPRVEVFCMERPGADTGKIKSQIAKERKKQKQNVNQP